MGFNRIEEGLNRVFNGALVGLLMCWDSFSADPKGFRV